MLIGMDVQMTDAALVCTVSIWVLIFSPGAQGKAQIVDRMVELDHEAPDFWRYHRDAIIADSILTNRRKDYNSHKLSEMLCELTRSDAHTSPTFKKMCVIRDKFSRLGTFKY